MGASTNPPLAKSGAGPIGVQAVELMGMDVERSVRSSRLSIRSRLDRSRANRSLERIFVREYLEAGFNQRLHEVGVTALLL
jgi:hypothetical protein